ncbi:putative ribonuclease H-like domain-containing protein, partial [Tanacetum coccineum]
VSAQDMDDLMVQPGYKARKNNYYYFLKPDSNLDDDLYSLRDNDNESVVEPFGQLTQLSLEFNTVGQSSHFPETGHLFFTLDMLFNSRPIDVCQNEVEFNDVNESEIESYESEIVVNENIDPRNVLADDENTFEEPGAQKEKKEWEVKFEATLARFEKWKESSKNLKKLINSSMSTRTKIGLGFKEYFGKDEVFDLSTPSVFNPEPVEEDKPLYSWFVKAGEMHAVPPSITGTYMPTPYKSDMMKNTGNDKSSDSETYASCDSSLKTKTKDFPPTVDITTFAMKSDVKTQFPLLASKTTSSPIQLVERDPTASRNRPAVNSAGRPNPAGWSKRPAPVSAGRQVSAGWLNPAARPYFRPSSVYFNNMYWPNLYDPMYKGRWGTAVKTSAGSSQNWLGSLKCTNVVVGKICRVILVTENDIGIVDSGSSRSMTGNKEKLDDFVQVKGGIVKFGGGDGRISGKGTIRTSKLDFENVYYVEELQHFNLFSVSQICDKKNKVLFTDTDCLVLTEDFQLPDESQVVLRIPRKCDLYTFSISELQPEQNVTCLVAKASLDESTRWHRRMAHVNFKTINKLAKEGLVDGLPLKVFTNEHNCVACNKGKQHKASYKHISAVRLITEPLQLLHMDLFGPTNIRSIDQKYYSLVVTDDFSRFTWTFYLGTKDETFYVLKEFIALIENQLNKKVKGIRCDNGTEFKNAKLIELCGEKGIKRDYSNPRTPQQNGVAERKNRTLIEAARTMLADSKLPTMFWTEAVSTACYVLNRVSITNPHNKTPYELISGKVPQIGTQETNITEVLPQAMVLVLWEAMQGYAEELAKLQRQEYEAKDAAARYGYFTSVSAEFIPVHTDEVYISPGQSIGLGEKTTRFPVPSHNVNQFLQKGRTPFSQFSDSGDLASPGQKDLKTKRDARGIVVRNKARVVSTGKTRTWDCDGELKKKCMSLSLSLKILTSPEGPMIIHSGLKLCMGSSLKHLEPGMQDCLLFCYNTITEERKVEFEMSAMGEMTFFLGLQVKQLPDGIFISQDKYVKDMLTKFDMESVRTATTPYEAAKTKLKDDTDPPVNVHLYRSMIGSLMYLTASRPDIMFAVSACSRHQVTPLTSHLNAVKKIFKYLKGQPKLGLWYPKDSPFQLEAYSDSDYAGSHGDRKSTTGGCQFLGRRLISWQCKKQTIVATSSTESTNDANENNFNKCAEDSHNDNVAGFMTKDLMGPRFEYSGGLIGMVVILLLGVHSSGLTGWFCGRTMFWLVGYPSAGWRLVYVGRSTMILCVVVILSAGRLVSAGRTMVLLVVILSAGRLVSVLSFCWHDWFSAGRNMFCGNYHLLDALLVVYAAITSIHAAGLVCADSIMFLLADLFLLVVTCFCCAQLDIAGWLVSATSHWCC